MPAWDEEQFESYLKKFQPVVADALPIKVHRLTSWQRWLLWSAGAATSAILALVSFHMVASRHSEKNRTSLSHEIAPPHRPLTMRDANAVLATAPSYKAAVDSMAFHPQSSTIPNNQQSALAVLAKEKIKL